MALIVGTSAATWYLTDRQGSIGGILNASALTGLRKFDAFGNVTLVSGSLSVFDRLGFTGRDSDPSTGFQHNGGRWFDPTTQHWTTRDPIEFDGGYGNLYLYVGNNATNLTDPTGLYAWYDFVNSWDTVLGDRRTGWFAKTSDFSAGAADTISGGATAKIRQGLGYDDVVDKSGAAYRYGGYAGEVVNIGLMVANPAGAARWALRGASLLNKASMVSGAIDAGAAALNGDFTGALMAGGGLALGQLRGAGSTCMLRGAAAVGQRVLGGVGAVGGLSAIPLNEA